MEMEDGIYLIIVQNIVHCLTALIMGLSRKDEESRMMARVEYREQMELYRKGEIAYRPSFMEIYDRLQNKY